MTISQVSARVHPNTDVLRILYTDFSRLQEYAADDMILHRADRNVGDLPVSGRQAVLAHEQALLDLTGGTLNMDVELVAANDNFGAVLGILRASQPRDIAMPFCGLWRFEGGRIVEHWENAYDPTALIRLLT